MFFLLGSDIVGVVKVVGEGVKWFKVGDEVFGMILWGGYVEEVVVFEKLCFFKLFGMDFLMVVFFMMVYGIFYYVLKDWVKFKEGEMFLVLGVVGGVGFIVVELGKLMGVKVIVVVFIDEKFVLC